MPVMNKEATNNFPQKTHTYVLKLITHNYIISGWKDIGQCLKNAKGN